MESEPGQNKGLGQRERKLSFGGQPQEGERQIGTKQWEERSWIFGKLAVTGKE